MYNHKPKISIVIGSYNFKKYIRECIESIINQTLKPYEIIICDDASTDSSQEIIQEYADKYPDLIKIVLHKQNIGPAKNFNGGFEILSGDYRSWIDGDDKWAPEKLEFEYGKLCDNPNARIAYSNVITIDYKGDIVNTWHDSEEQLPEGNVYSYIIGRTLFPAKSTATFRNFLLKMDTDDKMLFDDNLSCYWDWDKETCREFRHL